MGNRTRWSVVRAKPWGLPCKREQVPGMAEHADGMRKRKLLMQFPVSLRLNRPWHCCWDPALELR